MLKNLSKTALEEKFQPAKFEAFFICAVVYPVPPSLLANKLVCVSQYELVIVAAPPIFLPSPDSSSYNADTTEWLGE